VKSDLPLVSIVTPSFNQAAYLEQTILSVLSQHYGNLEYGIVDGKSTDSSLRIIKKYAERLSWWVSEKDQGQAEAINKGFQRAGGQFIAWLNSDDQYLPGAIEGAVRCFAEHPNAVIVHGDVVAVDADNHILNIIRYKDWGLLGLMKFQIIGQPAVFIRKTALDKAGFLDSSYHLLLDHQLWLRVGQLGEIIHVKEPWASARFHEHAKNIALAAQFGDEAKRIAEWMPTQPGLRDFYIKNKRVIYAGAYRLSARYLLDSNQPRKAISEYWQSIKQHPSTGLKEWHRILFALLALLGLSRLRKTYLESKANRFQKRSRL
jgi:glycosyltransferase involved in cell wall biosynthesis